MIKSISINGFIRNHHPLEVSSANRLFGVILDNNHHVLTYNNESNYFLIY